ncbi:NUDIX hydrolase [candidate division WWE3 bacterium]|uniref:NUDIX hydrolase n=1 Tax=candidate division WWE3 bacterium TaxID=2053526 RepID=A0A955LV95_UNCKA|nr:NUDIX hydrolase [candidate division WWE3 bacterium]
MSEKKLSLYVTALIFNSHNKLLIVKRRYGTEVLPGKWGYPGGMVEEGQTIEDALYEEVFEETGVNVAIKRI